MNIRDIHVFQTVAKTRNLTKAAQLLYMTPQGVSKIIRNLEQEFQCDFFVRKPSGMELTPGGACFSAYADNFAVSYQTLQNDLLHIQQQENAVVDLLSAYGILRLVTPECINAFMKAHPDIDFHYREYPDRQVERLFDEHEGNVAFSIADFDDTKYDITELASFPLMLLVNKSNPLSQKSSVTIEDLKDQPLYIENSEFKLHHQILDKCKAAGFSPNIVFETCGFSLCYKMVRENKGVSVTVDFVTDDIQKENLTLLPFSDGEYRWRICMLTRKADTHTPALQLFQKHVLDWIKNTQDGSIPLSAL